MGYQCMKDWLFLYGSVSTNVLSCMQLLEQQRRDRLGRVVELNFEDSQVTAL